MPSADSDPNKQRLSESLFSDSGIARTPSRPSSKEDPERLRRRKIFYKFILPPFLLLLIFLGFLLYKPVKYMISGPSLPPPPPEHHSEAAEPVPEENKNKKVYGNPDAALQIFCRFDDAMFAPEAILELAHDAVASKPSEIGFTLEYRMPQPGEEPYQILLNGETKIEIDHPNEKRLVDLATHPKNKDFAAAIEAMHRKIYGEVAKPLKVALSEKTIEKQRIAKENAPAEIIPENTASEIKSDGKTILLPGFKAETSGK